MEPIPISLHNQYNNNANIPTNYIISQKNSLHHGKSPSNPNLKKQILINQIQNNYYNNYNTNNPIENLDTNYNKYNVTNNYYGNQIINNNYNYYSSSRNIRDNFYNEPMNNNIHTINKVTKLNPNLNLDDNTIINNIDTIQTPKSDMNFIKKSKSKEKFKNMIKNIDVNMDYENDNDNDNISYFDLSNLKNKFMKMNNVKVINNSLTKNGPNHVLKNVKVNLSVTNTSRKNSKVKNKITYKIPHNSIKSITLYPSNITENNEIKFSTGNSKKTMSKIPINMKKKIYEIKKVQNDEESEINSQLYNTNAFSNRNRLDDNTEKNIEDNENKKYIIKKEKKIYNKDNNLDIESENI